MSLLAVRTTSLTETLSSVQPVMLNARNVQALSTQTVTLAQTPNSCTSDSASRIAPTDYIRIPPTTSALFVTILVSAAPVAQAQHAPSAQLDFIWPLILASRHALTSFSLTRLTAPVRIVL